jgi:hypothetical protein
LVNSFNKSPAVRCFCLVTPEFNCGGFSFILITDQTMNALQTSTAFTYDFKTNVRKTGSDQEQVVEDSIVDHLNEKDDKWLVCRQCRQKITKPEARISINGSHRHTFANPNGIVFEIGCFSQYRGCSSHGPPSTEFAWFAGYSWQIIVCSKCLTHLGWLFVSHVPKSFAGLVLDRIIQTSFEEK